MQSLKCKSPAICIAFPVSARVNSSGKRICPVSTRLATPPFSTPFASGAYMRKDLMLRLPILPVPPVLPILPVPLIPPVPPVLPILPVPLIPPVALPPLPPSSRSTKAARFSGLSKSPLTYIPSGT